MCSKTPIINIFRDLEDEHNEGEMVNIKKNQVKFLEPKNILSLQQIKNCKRKDPRLGRSICNTCQRTCTQDT